MDYNTSPMRNHTRYTYQEWCEFQKCHPNQAFLILLVFGVLSIVPQAACLVYAVKEHDALWLHIATILGFSVAFSMLMVSVRFKFGAIPLAAYKKYMVNTANGSQYAFFNYSMNALSQQEGYVNEVKMQYDRIQAVMETRNLFCLYTSEGLAFLVNKSCFESGSADELRQLLQVHIPAEKWKIKK